MRLLPHLVGILFFFTLAPSLFGQEGHLNWYFDAKKADFIVEGTIKYDSSTYYEVNPVNIPGQDQKYYWIVGKLKINKVLFLNKESQYLEEYQQYVKEIEKEQRVLIPATRSIDILDAPADKNGRGTFPLVLFPLLLDIPADGSIFNLSEIFLFPLLNLKLDSGVPTKDIPEARILIEKRLNNLIKKKS